ncbi:unnamed protein product, partial [Brachionus calyciflorus]
FPDLEKEAKEFSKACSLSLQSLANFIDKRFRENPDNDLSEDEFVRSAEFCRTDLLKGRAKKFSSPFNISLILKTFIIVLIMKMVFIKWMAPVRKKQILVSHDDDTGEVDFPRS